MEPENTPITTSPSEVVTSATTAAADAVSVTSEAVTLPSFTIPKPSWPEGLLVVDGVLLLIVALAMVRAFRRGLVGEVLHTAVFFTAFCVGYALFGSAMHQAGEAGSSSLFLTSLAYFLGFTLLVSWAVARLVGPWLFANDGPLPLNGLVAAFMAAARLALALLMLNLVFVLAAPTADRLQSLPAWAQNSQLLNWGDRTAAQLYRFLENHNLLQYVDALRTAGRSVPVSAPEADAQQAE